MTNAVRQVEIAGKAFALWVVGREEKAARAPR